MEQTTAQINYSVMAECPHCYENFDIDDQLSESDIIAFKEANTDKKIEITCPECGEVFEVSIVY